MSHSDLHHASIYDDGLLLCLIVDENAAHLWAIVLNTTEYGQSKDGMLWVFILRGDPDELFAVVGALGATRYPDWYQLASYKDNRELDAHLIDQFVARVRRVMDNNQKGGISDGE